MDFAKYLPTIPYGGVYFRKSSPPREDWERDYQTASQDGMNCFRHWLMWSAVELAPGKFDWDDYDRQLDLAAKYNVKAIIGEILHAAPEWAFRKYPHALYENAEGRKSYSSIRNSSATGGFSGLCFDNEDIRELAEHFLREMAARYKNHPGLGGYDLWNETNTHSSPNGGCYCAGSAEKFREWLQAKYGDLKTVAEAWRRHSFVEWADVVPPRQLAPYPDSLDWVQFRIDNAYRLLQWRVDVVRSVDPDHPIVAHGVEEQAIIRMAKGCDDFWRASEPVDAYGFSPGGSCYNRQRKGWRAFLCRDIVRSGAHGKPFWDAEMTAGPNWNHKPDKTPRDSGRIPQAADIRLNSMISFVGGATGIFSPRWRPLLDGSLAGVYGFYDIDGSRTERSEMGGRIARWANDEKQKDLWKSRPVKGDIGIIVVPESQLHCSLHFGGTEYYSGAVKGAYQAFHDSNIQADLVYIKHIDDYDLLYLPFPLSLKQETASRLAAWVAAGGTLISEGCPGYYNDAARIGAVQPNLGLDQVFGARQEYIEFVPDLLENEFFDGAGRKMNTGVYKQAYRLAGGAASGFYEDGRVAMVDHAYGRGRTRLIGTVPGMGYWQHPDNAEGRAFFADLLAWAGRKQQISSSEGLLTPRLWSGAGGTYLWVVNCEKELISAELALSEQWGPFKDCQLVWGESKPAVDGRLVRASVPGRDVIIVRLI